MRQKMQSSNTAMEKSFLTQPIMLGLSLSRFLLYANKFRNGSAADQTLRDVSP